MWAKAKRRAGSLRERWRQRLKGLPVLLGARTPAEDGDHHDASSRAGTNGGGKSGVGGLAVIALLGLVAFGCGVAVLTYAAFTLADLRHTYRHYSPALCTITGHSTHTRLRCFHAACRPMVRALLVVTYAPDGEANLVLIDPPAATPQTSNTTAAAEDHDTGSASATPHPVHKAEADSMSRNAREYVQEAGVLPTTTVLVNTTARWRAGHQWMEETAAREFLAQNPINSTRECFYDARKPYNVVMHKEYATTLSFWSWLCGSLVVSAICILLAAYLLHLVVLWAPSTDFSFSSAWRKRHSNGAASIAGTINASSNYYGTFTGHRPTWNGDYVPISGLASDDDEVEEIELQTRRQQRRQIA